MSTTCGGSVHAELTLFDHEGTLALQAVVDLLHLGDLDAAGKQYVVGPDGERVPGVWVLPPEIPSDPVNVAAGGPVPSGS
jgi:hypothetical protein